MRFHGTAIYAKHPRFRLQIPHFESLFRQPKCFHWIALQKIAIEGYDFRGSTLISPVCDTPHWNGRNNTVDQLHRELGSVLSRHSSAAFGYQNQKSVYFAICHTRSQYVVIYMHTQPKRYGDMRVESREIRTISQRPIKSRLRDILDLEFLLPKSFAPQ